MSSDPFSDSAQEAYHLAYEQTRCFLNRTLEECWWAEREEYEELFEDSERRESTNHCLPLPLTPSVCSTSAMFLRHQSMPSSDIVTNHANTINPRIPAFRSFPPSGQLTHRRRRDASFNNNLAARGWTTYTPIAPGEAILASSGMVSLGFDRSHAIDSASASSTSSSRFDDVYSTWNHDMAQVMMTTKAHQSRWSSQNQNLWLQPPVAGLPGGWSSANIVHATHQALEQYVQHAMDLQQTSSNSSTSSSPSKMKQEENVDSTVYNLVYYIFNGTFPSSSSSNDTVQHSTYIHSSLQELGQSMPRKVCQHPFKKNELVWVCRTCQSDETCVLCHACYQHSCHEGHDVSFYHAQAGGK